MNKPSHTPSKLPGLKASVSELPMASRGFPTLSVRAHSASHSRLSRVSTELTTVGASGFM